jgi:hypothetical protein
VKPFPSHCGEGWWENEIFETDAEAGETVSANASPTTTDMRLLATILEQSDMGLVPSGGAIRRTHEAPNFEKIVANFGVYLNSENGAY